MKPKILVYDIETAPAIGLFFGKPYDTNIAKIIQHEYVFGFAYKWVGEKQTRTCYIWDFPSYNKKLVFRGKTLASVLDDIDRHLRNSSIEVIKKWAELASEAQVMAGHNSDQFDYKQMHGRLMLYDLPPIAKPLTFDTKKAAKQIGWFPSNSLDSLGERLGIGRKLPHNNYPNKIDLWWDCMNDVEKAKRHMVLYNKYDVMLTEALYLRERPHALTHPNMALLADQPDICPRCGVKAGFSSGGYKYTTVHKYRYWECRNCHRKIPGRTKEPLNN